MADTSVGTAVIDIKFNLGDLNKQLNQALGGGGGVVGGAGSVAGGAFAGSFLGVLGNKISEFDLSKVFRDTQGVFANIGNSLRNNFDSKFIKDMGESFRGVSRAIESKMGPTLSLLSDKVKILSYAFKELAPVLGPIIGSLLAMAAASTAFLIAWAKDETAILRMPLLFRDATKEAEKFFDTLASRTGLSSDDIRAVGNEVQSMLVPFLLDRGKAEKQMEELTARIFDVSAASGVAASEVGVLFESILQGNMRAAKRLDILMSDTLVDSTALEMSHKTSKDQLTEQEKVLARIKLLMEQTDDRAGAFADRALTVAGSWHALWSQIKEFGSALGRIISGFTALPVILKSSADVLSVINSILGAIGWVADKVGNVFKTIYTWARGLLDIFSSIFFEWGTGMDRINKLGDIILGIWDKIKNIWGKKDLGKDGVEKLKDDLKQGKESAASIADDIKSINTEAQKLASKSRFDFLAMGNQEGGISFTTGEGHGSIGKSSAKAFEDFLENSKRLLGVNEEQVKLLREVAKGNNSVFA